MRHNLGSAAAFPEGGSREVVVAGRSIGIFNVGGRLYALRNRCPHQGGPLCSGRVVKHLESDRPGEYRYNDDRFLVECPWHGWEFDLETGKSWFDPARTRVRFYPVHVERVPTEVTSGPYTAETFPVMVEQECVFVEVEA